MSRPDRGPSPLQTRSAALAVCSPHPVYFTTFIYFIAYLLVLFSVGVKGQESVFFVRLCSPGALSDATPLVGAQYLFRGCLWAGWRSLHGLIL